MSERKIKTQFQSLSVRGRKLVRGELYASFCLRAENLAIRWQLLRAKSTTAKSTTKQKVLPGNKIEQKVLPGNKIEA
jgi:hypothetical protein